MMLERSQLKKKILSSMWSGKKAKNPKLHHCQHCFYREEGGREGGREVYRTTREQTTLTASNVSIAVMTSTLR